MCSDLSVSELTVIQNGAGTVQPLIQARMEPGTAQVSRTELIHFDSKFQPGERSLSVH